MDNKNNLIIAGHPIILSFTMRDWERLEDEICTIEELDSALKRKGRIKIIYKILAILAHDDLVTEDWLKLNFRPHMLAEAVNAINTTIITALSTKEDETAGHDVVLEELQKKADSAD